MSEKEETPADVITLYVKEEGEYILGYLDPEGEVVEKFENCPTMHRIMSNPPVHCYTEDEHYWYDEVVWLTK